MKIVVLGDNLLAVSMAHLLFRKGHDVSLVLDRVFFHSFFYREKNLPFQCIEGSLTSLSALEQAGIDDAEMILLLSQYDERNIVASMVAEKIFHVPLQIMALQSFEFDCLPDFFNRSYSRGAMVIHPDHLVLGYCLDIIRNPQVEELFNVFDGAFRLVVVEVSEQSTLCGQLFSSALHDWFRRGVYFLALSRSGRIFLNTEETRVLPYDHILVLSMPKALGDFLKQVSPYHVPIKRIMLNSGYDVGFKIAKSLQDSHDVCLFEMDRSRYGLLLNDLGNILVLSADVSDPFVLREEGVEKVDLFLAVGPDDKVNMMSSFMAKKMGAKKTLLLTQHSDYQDFLDTKSVDFDLSHSSIVSSKIMGFLRLGDVRGVYALKFAGAEVLEIVIHGDSKHSRVVGRKLQDLRLPQGVVICGVIRGSVSLFFEQSFVLEDKDRVVLLIYHGSTSCDYPESLFQVDAGFFE
ncbi:MULTISPECIES: NAD-binding protein [Candidatus Ichthyocystis]|uniref:Putative TrkA domain protein n=2 Tax=Candidatus Ichthyocystis TaxID=2929841 RepID=A0A0S4M015_9BURK|nr:MULTISPECIES: NAD-binding protein [Ichthyocystis]CUT17161.1 putative TrkA domain protein [Candidatus Ichthyocystis hellenicum]